MDKKPISFAPNRRLEAAWLQRAAARRDVPIADSVDLQAEVDALRAEMRQLHAERERRHDARRDAIRRHVRQIVGLWKKKQPA